MKAIVVYPGTKDSVSCEEIPKPEYSDDEILIKTLKVGIDGTDREINEGLYGTAPEGSEYLILGHEALGEVIAIGKKVSGFHIGDLVVPTVRRPDDCIYCQQGFFDLCIKGNYKERGIKEQHGYMAEFFVEYPKYLIQIPSDLKEIAVLLEPLSVVEKGIRESWEMQMGRMPWQPHTAVVFGMGMIGILAALVLNQQNLDVWVYSRDNVNSEQAINLNIVGIHYISAQDVPINEITQKIGKNIDFILEATGNSSVALSAISIIGLNGIVCLTSVTGGSRMMKLDVDQFNIDLVLGNRTIMGTVNANYKDFQQGLKVLHRYNQKDMHYIKQFMPDIIKFDDLEHILNDIKSPHMLKSIINFES
jgi:threonine dehydrogenase-like Zn-dependent dehydrogenase